MVREGHGVPLCKLPVCLLGPVEQRLPSRDLVWVGVAGSVYGFVSKDGSFEKHKSRGDGKKLNGL